MNKRSLLMVVVAMLLCLMLMPITASAYYGTPDPSKSYITHGGGSGSPLVVTVYALDSSYNPASGPLSASIRYNEMGQYYTGTLYLTNQYPWSGIYEYTFYPQYPSYGMKQVTQIDINFGSFTLTKSTSFFIW